MPASITCPDCVENYLNSLPKCPHCGRPGGFPNVNMVSEGKAALDARLSTAVTDAKTRGAEDRLNAFINIIQDSHLAMNRPLSFVLELADERGVYPTFYQRRDAGLIFPGGDEWDLLREAADSRLFGAFKEEIRFATLSTGGRGLTSYGECTMIPSERFVSFRTSFSEENSALRLKNRGFLPVGQPLFRPEELATWDDRNSLATSKVAPFIETTTPDAAFPDMLISPGATTDDDVFVEGHIYGPMTLRSFRSISLPARSQRFKKSVIKGLAEKLRKVKIAAPNA